jgi:hypothetical protein
MYITWVLICYTDVGLLDLELLQIEIHVFFLEKIPQTIVEIVKSGNEKKIAAGGCFINVVCVCGYVYKTISKGCKKNNTK